jgi:peptidyl-tRNA hydrolase
MKYDNKWKAEMLVSEDFGDKVIFCAPQTYMNAS